MPLPSIRQANPADADQIAAVLHSIEELRPIVAEPLAETTTRIHSMLALSLTSAGSLIVVAELDSGVTGYCAIHWYPNMLRGVEGYISELFVSPQYRSQGIGALLLDHVLAASRDRGCQLVRLVNRRDRASYTRGFYAKHGWIENTLAAQFEYQMGVA